MIVNLLHLYKMKGLKDLFTPTQILERNPNMRRKWNCTKIGYLFYCEVIDGKKLRRGCLVSESDLLDLYARRFNVTKT